MFGPTSRSYFILRSKEDLIHSFNIRLKVRNGGTRDDVSSMNDKKSLRPGNQICSCGGVNLDLLTWSPETVVLVWCSRVLRCRIVSWLSLEAGAHEMDIKDAANRGVKDEIGVGEVGAGRPRPGPGPIPT